MLLSAVSVLVVAQSSSEMPEVLMNNPLYYMRKAIYEKEKSYIIKKKRCRQITINLRSAASLCILVTAERSPS